MKVVVIGLGSMGRRRVRLMKTLPNPPEILGVDMSPARRSQAEAELGIETCESLDMATRCCRLHAALVCTSPIAHETVVMDCLNAGLHVFTEINLIGTWYDKAISLARSKGLTLFISSTFLYRKEIEFIIKAVNGECVNYIYHSGQYLPDWHPWESYKDFFVSDKRTNACREIMAIEFPWLIKAFGEVESVNVMRGNLSSLDLDFPDNYVISMRHKNGSKGVFCQDVVSRKGLRRLEVYSERLHLFWEGTPQSLEAYNVDTKELKKISLYGNVEHLDGYNVNIVENAYREELLNFFAVLDGKDSPRHTFQSDKEILALIDRIEGGVYG